MTSKFNTISFSFNRLFVEPIDQILDAIVDINVLILVNWENID